MEDLNSLFGYCGNGNDDKDNEIFEEKREALFDCLPFSYQEEEIDDYNLFDMDLENLDFKLGKSDRPEDVIDSQKFMERLNSFDDNYFKKIVVEEDKAILSTTTRVSFRSNILIAEKTLPGILISFMKRKKTFVSEDEILEFIAPKFNSLRKTNGAFYQGNITTTLKSALSSSGVFEKNDYGCWYYKEKEAMNYIIKINEKILTKKLEKEKKEDQIKSLSSQASKSTKTSKTNPKVSKKSKKKQGKLKNAYGDVNFKLIKVYNILDGLLAKYRSVPNMKEKLQNPFKGINSSLDLLKKIGDENVCVGILMCFKYFKSLITKFFKLAKKKKEEEEYMKMHDKLVLLNSRMEYIEKNIQFNKNQMHL